VKDNQKVVAIRGAITANSNTEIEILQQTEVLLKQIFKTNQLSNDSIISIFFTMTDDLDATYPAKAARILGITQAALMCARELPVPNSLKKCIRVMIHCYLDENKDPKHIYLGEAKSLRPDLMEN